jgi:guanine deaminase
LLLAAALDHRQPCTEDKYLSTQLGAVEMVLKGCTACYDLSFDTAASAEDWRGRRGYADVGMRAV